MTTATMTTQHEHHAYLCDDCEMEIAEHDFVGRDGKKWRLCHQCQEEAREICEEVEKEEEQEEELGICVSCQKEKATISFMHITNGNFELCNRCFEWADHERDYGNDFGENSSTEEGEK